MPKIVALVQTAATSATADQISARPLSPLAVGVVWDPFLFKINSSPIPAGSPVHVTTEGS